MKHLQHKKYWSLLASLMTVSFFLGGCVSRNTDSFSYRLIARPISQLLEWFADIFQGNYGYALIFLVIIIRFLLLPLTFKQQEAAIIGTEKRKYYQSYLSQFQTKIQEAQSSEEKMLYTQQQQAFMKENGISLFGNMGCLPLLIQLPILSGMYMAIYTNQSIQEYTFYGLPLGERSIVLTVIFVLLSVLQMKMSLVTMPEEARKQHSSSMLFMPLMMGLFSYSTAAGISLYLVTTTIIGVIQQFFINKFIRPRLVEQIDKEMKDKPIQFEKFFNAATPSTSKKPKEVNPKKATKNRNAGKQSHS